METDLISAAELLDHTFPGGRPTASGKHHQWDKLFLRVKPAGKSKRLSQTTQLCRKDPLQTADSGDVNGPFRGDVNTAGAKRRWYLHDA